MGAATREDERRLTEARRDGEGAVVKRDLSRLERPRILHEVKGSEERGPGEHILDGSLTVMTTGDLRIHVAEEDGGVTIHLGKQQTRKRVVYNAAGDPDEIVTETERHRIERDAEGNIGGMVSVPTDEYDLAPPPLIDPVFTRLPGAHSADGARCVGRGRTSPRADYVGVDTGERLCRSCGMTVAACGATFIGPNGETVEMET